MHYAVESTLGLRDSFFGLIARGWHVPDFEQSGIAARLPAEAIHTECMVNQLLIDIADGLTPNTEDFNRLIQAAAAQSPRHANVSPRSLSDDELHNIRRRYAELSAALITTDAGTMIELEFEDHA